MAKMTRMAVGTLLLAAAFSARAQTAALTSFHWWPADGTGTDTLGGVTASLVNGAGYAPGYMGQAFSLNESGATNAYVDFGTQVGNPGVSNFIVTFAVQTSQALPNMHTYILSKRDSCVGSFWDIAISRGYVVAEIDDGANYSLLHGNTIVNDGVWHVVTLARIGTVASLSIDGNTPVITPQPTAANIVNGAGFLAGKIQSGCDPGVPFVGKIDNVQVISGQ